MDVYCRSCLVERHRMSGLHRIEVCATPLMKVSFVLNNTQEWSEASQHFIRTSFQRLGHRFQLGHTRGEKCRFPVKPAGDKFTIIDTNGIHKVCVDFCGCEKAKSQYVQVLRFGWFPATVNFPKTATTQRALKMFDILSCESKCLILEFWNTISRLYDNTGTEDVIVSANHSSHQTRLSKLLGSL